VTAARTLRRDLVTCFHLKHGRILVDSDVDNNYDSVIQNRRVFSISGYVYWQLSQESEP